MPIKREIVYPIFLECCAFAIDTFWENVFEDLAYGKTPYGSYISKGFLCCSYRKKDFSYKIERKNARTIYDDVYRLLTTKLGLLSPQQKIKKRKDFADFENNMRNRRDSWSNIRKKNIRELLLELYVTRMKNKYSLSIEQARFLLSTLFMAMAFKVITTQDIEYSDGQIHNIVGIQFNKKEIIIERDLYGFDTPNVSVTTPEKKLMSEQWGNYLKELKRNKS